MPSRRCGGFEGLQCAASLHGAFKSKTTRLSCARHTRGVFGKREISAKLFFAIVWAGENSRRSFFLPWFRGTLRAWGMLGVRNVRRRLCGDFGRRQEATERQRAMRVRGSAQGREMSLTRFVFFRLLSSSLHNR